MRREERAAARADAPPALPCVLSDAGDDDVEPTTRLGLIEASAAAALGAATVGPVPTRAGEIDPALVDHWTNLLRLLGGLDAMCGPRDVLAAVTREIALIAAHRDAARGALHIALMRVEARWCEFAAWLGNDTGDTRSRDGWTDRAQRLAEDSGYPDMIALAQERRSQWAAQDGAAARALNNIGAALSVSGASVEARTICALRAAHAHALSGAKAACEQHLSNAFELAEEHTSSRAATARNELPAVMTARAAEARCWLALQPPKAIGLYEAVLRDWPGGCLRDGGLQQARLALACAKTGELDRARAEGRKALAIAKQTKSTTAARELKRWQLALPVA